MYDIEYAVTSLALVEIIVCQWVVPCKDGIMRSKSIEFLPGGLTISCCREERARACKGPGLDVSSA